MSVNGKTFGIALSGGGYRATLFGLGSLWRLNDAGLLGKLDRVTSVSGGSILAGILAHRWKTLQFENGCAANFGDAIARPVRKFCSQTIDVGSGVAGALVPFKSAGDFLVHRYSRDLFGDTLLKDIPVADRKNNPCFIFYATNMQTGRSFRFRQDMIADYMIGLNRATDIPLSVAVAASSAFPPIFSPIVLKTDPETWSGCDPSPGLEKLRKSIYLADGGIYDNMGLESLGGKVDIMLVSDAGAPFKTETKPAGDYVFQLGRVRDILIEQTRALRKRWLVEEFKAERLRGAYWGIGTQMAAYAENPVMTPDTDLTESLKSVPTRLCAFNAERQGRLINWGYALCDISLRARAGIDVPMAEKWPVPEYSFG